MIWCFYFIVSVCGGKGALLVTWVEEGANCPGKILTDEMTTINNIRSKLFAITVYENLLLLYNRGYRRGWGTEIAPNNMIATHLAPTTHLSDPSQRSASPRKS